MFYIRDLSWYKTVSTFFSYLSTYFIISPFHVFLLSLQNNVKHLAADYIGSQERNWSISPKHYAVDNNLSQRYVKSVHHIM